MQGSALLYHCVILSGVKRSRSFVSMRAKPRNEVTKGSRYPIPPRFHLRCCFAVRLRFAPLRMTRWGKAREEQAPPLRVVEGADPYKNRYSNLCRALLKHSQCQPKLNPPKSVKIRAISRKLTRKVRTLLRSFSKNIIKFSPI